MGVIADGDSITNTARAMCCFSRPVDSVTTTRIFARGFTAGPESERQFLVYSMRLAAKQELAMVLPIPVKPKSGESAARFIDLKRFPTFFDGLEAGFPEARIASSPTPSRSLSVAPARLKVHEVGEFQASFVPTVAAFSRLDKRFRLPPGTWEKLPQYWNYGFAVFKLKPGAKAIHPMAFSFPRANPKQVFFPTLHIHDGEVHAQADFDHVLYCQRNVGEKYSLLNWRESPQLAKNFIDAAKAQQIIDPALHCFRLKLQETLKNEDTVLA